MSTINLSPYVNFQGHAREAMEFYRHALGGGKVELQTLNERGESRPAGPGEQVATARLEVDGALIVGSDGHPKFPAKVGENLAIALNGTDRERLTKAFDFLAEGGQVKGRLTKQPSGAEVGYLLDKFGINWVVSIEQR